MTLLKRIGYYLGGFSIGLVLLAFFLSGKKTSCDYSPSARVKKNIRTKKHSYSEEVSALILSKKIERNDSTLRQSSFVFLEFLFRFDRPFFWPAAGLKPDT